MGFNVEIRGHRGGRRTSGTLVIGSVEDMHGILGGRTGVM